jgi:hypothetical protein
MAHCACSSSHCSWVVLGSFPIPCHAFIGIVYGHHSSDLTLTTRGQPLTSLKSKTCSLADLHAYWQSLNCMHNRANRTNERANDNSAKTALAFPSPAESEQPLTIVGLTYKLQRRLADLSTLLLALLCRVLYCYYCPSNLYINSPSHPILSDATSTTTASPLNTAIMRYSSLLMIAASVFVVAQDAEPASSALTTAEPSNTLTGIYREASRASAMEESQRSAASVDRTATDPGRQQQEVSRASAMEESQRSAASVDRTATDPGRQQAEVSRASAMEESQRSAASVARTATDPGRQQAEVSRASAMEESQRSAASVARTATDPGRQQAEVSRASAMEASQRAAAQSDKENVARETGFPALMGAAGLAFAALL